jgi:hypothetical protein
VIALSGTMTVMCGWGAADAATLAKFDLHGADITSASTINLETATGDLIDVTGTTTITAITLSEGHERTVRFTGVMVLTNGASLVLPGNANITTAPGDFAVFRGYASGVVRCVNYSKLTGRPIFGRPPSIQVFTSGSGTYTTPAGVTAIKVTIVGGGAGGGGSSGSTGVSGAAGGGAGATAIKYIYSPSATYLYAVGAGGGASSPGGTTTFGTSLISAGGGAAGIGAANNAIGGAGGNASGGDVNISGGHGFTGFNNTGGGFPAGGNGGASSLGGGGCGVINLSGGNGQVPGSGGSGASNGTGGSGAAGLIIVEEFY